MQFQIRFVNPVLIKRFMEDTFQLLWYCVRILPCNVLYEYADIKITMYNFLDPSILFIAPKKLLTYIVIEGLNVIFLYI